MDPYKRIMAALSVYNVLLSISVYFMGTWMTPWETDWWGAAGNAYTCSAQVFSGCSAGLESRRIRHCSRRR